MLNCDESVYRPERFTPDPDLERYTSLDLDYRHSGYDRGHNMSFADNECVIM